MALYPREWFGSTGGSAGSSISSGVEGNLSFGSDLRPSTGPNMGLGFGTGSAGTAISEDLPARLALLEYAFWVERLLAGALSAKGAEVQTKYIEQRPTYRTVNVALAGGGSQVITYLGTA